MHMHMPNPYLSYVLRCGPITFLFETRSAKNEPSLPALFKTSCFKNK